MLLVHATYYVNGSGALGLNKELAIALDLEGAPGLSQSSQALR